MSDSSLYQDEKAPSTSRRAAIEFALFGVALVVIALDQYTKQWVRQNLEPGVSWNPISWLDPIVTLTHVHNTGAAFGLFPGMQYVFAGVALLVAALIVIYHRQLTDNSRFLHLAFGLQLGGALGNFIDRVFQGHVTDFIDFRVWPVFNVADSAVVVGTILLVYYSFFVGEPFESEDRTDALDSETIRGS